MQRLLSSLTASRLNGRGLKSFFFKRKGRYIQVCMYGAILEKLRSLILQSEGLSLPIKVLYFSTREGAESFRPGVDFHRVEPEPAQPAASECRMQPMFR